ncbi:Pkinase-domain-containing protein [Piedraia hortae CBS 480.64]|uniref:Pkinase-domain-containing protein n=1 Tax=Piedraia hortae CBS 480.64 TaxID=1314780 RepID=A0A6A7C2F2_9PEZI|nr:Pkinase-domain-containing protein [Piedraia hortae CBS 480.64]
MDNAELVSVKTTEHSSAVDDTQAFTQQPSVPAGLAYEVEDEEEEGVWGYLVPIFGTSDVLVMRHRSSCPVPASSTGTDQLTGTERVTRGKWRQLEADYEEKKAASDAPASGYLIGRHPECDGIINVPTVSNRHCIIFPESRLGRSTAVMEDLSGNGTYINDALVGRNKRRTLADGDEISILNVVRFAFRYPRNRKRDKFSDSYDMGGQIGKGHFATVFRCVQKTSGDVYAVKVFYLKKEHSSGKSIRENLAQEIAVLRGLSHPNIMCISETFEDEDRVCLILDLAECDLFKHISKGESRRLSEAETRIIFVQLFQGVKYLHERNIVHRDIKPENILLMDPKPTVKLADFGLAKIIGEDAFTTSLCGTAAYTAPEVLRDPQNRRYTKAVDVWSLGVVLYICVCGFPPFSDQLRSAKRPYRLIEQISLGCYDYPSPYWDGIGFAVRDLINHMLEVSVEKRLTVEGCLTHPWLANRPELIELEDYLSQSQGRLVQMQEDFPPTREKTLDPESTTLAQGGSFVDSLSRLGFPQPGRAGGQEDAIAGSSFPAENQLEGVGVGFQEETPSANTPPTH